MRRAAAPPRTARLLKGHGGLCRLAGASSPPRRPPYYRNTFDARRVSGRLVRGLHLHARPSLNRVAREGVGEGDDAGGGVGHVDLVRAREYVLGLEAVESLVEVVVGVDDRALELQ